VKNYSVWIPHQQRNNAVHWWMIEDTFGIGIDHAAHFALLLIRLDGMASSNQRIKIRRKKERSAILTHLL